MLTPHSRAMVTATPLLSLHFFAAEQRAVVQYALRYRASGPGSEEAADEDSGLLDLPVNPDEGADLMPEEDRPVPS